MDEVVTEFQNIILQPPTISFTQDINLNLGNREVQIKFLGRGNTAGDTVVYLPKEKIIVAHNAPNDYSFIRAEFRNLGLDYSRDSICTHILSRKVLPGHNSYSLGKLCKSLDIDIKSRHRAGDDALALPAPGKELKRQAQQGTPQPLILSGYSLFFCALHLSPAEE